MRTKNLSAMGTYLGETFPQEAGARIVYRGVSNGGVSLYVDGLLYAFSEGGDFAIPVVADADVLVSFKAAKGVDITLLENPLPTVQVDDPETMWTKHEPRPAVNPQLAALMASIKTLESRLDHAQTTNQWLASRVKHTETEVVEDPAPSTSEPDTAPTDGSEDV